MISDEMRELLSAYVDGELRDADAARVEDASKRDPELRRGIEAYRTLRRKLREWDAAEHGALPSPSLLGSTLARARSMDAALSAPARARFLGPLAAAAGLLVAASAGFLLAGSAAPEAPSHPEAGTPVALKPLEPMQDLGMPGSALAPRRAPGRSVVLSRIDDHLPSRRALEFEEAMHREELVRATPIEPEKRTATPLSAEINAMLEGCTALAAPKESLVVLARPALLTGFPSVSPAPSGRRISQDSSDGRILERLQGTSQVVAPLGEVWVGKDGRTRLVAASDWIAPREDMLVQVVWGDGVAAPPPTASRQGELLELQETILGPRLRRRILSAKAGADGDFLAWLLEDAVYGAAPLPSLLAADTRDRERAVNKLMDALRADNAASGFAVLDVKGRLLGVEIFHDHAMMLGFAPRLLRGYLLEAGDEGIRVAPPIGATGIATVRGFLEGLPGRSIRVDRKPLDDKDWGYGEAPKGLARVTLRNASGEAAGHGLVAGDTPIHLTLFGE